MSENVGCTMVTTSDFGASLSERVGLVMFSTSEFDFSGNKSSINCVELCLTDKMIKKNKTAIYCFK